MSRGRGGVGGGRGRAAATTSAPPPARTGSDFSAAIADGVGWGVGNAVAHRGVDAVVGPRTVQVEHVGSGVAPAASMGGSEACSLQSKAFQDCLDGYGNDIGKCQLYMDMLTECRRNSSSLPS